MKFVATAILALSLLPRHLTAQQPAADSGPTLAVTMQFLQDKLRGIGKLNYSTSWDGVSWSNITEEITDVATDASACMLRSTNYKEDAGNPVHWLTTWTVLLKDVETIEVTHQEDKQHYSGPPIFLLALGVPKHTVSMHGFFERKKKEDPQVTDQEFGSVGYSFVDEELANRVAKALRHAVDLCAAQAKAKSDVDSKKANEPF